MVDGAGDLWILLQSTKVLRYHDGNFELGREEAEFGITSVSRRRDGTCSLVIARLWSSAISRGQISKSHSFSLSRPAQH